MSGGTSAAPAAGELLRWRICGSFGVDRLELERAPLPTPGPGELLLRLNAISLNYRDLLMVRGHYNPNNRSR